MLLSVVFLKCIRTLHESEQWRLSGITASIEFVDRTLDRAREYQQKTEEKNEKGKRRGGNSKTSVRETRRTHDVCMVFRERTD